ncbi:hypothetical protein KKA53_05175 [Candidatus Dependentiae bacterium]|nr:hypothetical protein [Candidatus Dependentiae bacterium]
MMDVEGTIAKTVSDFSYKLRHLESRDFIDALEQLAEAVRDELDAFPSAETMRQQTSLSDDLLKHTPRGDC